MNSSQVPAKFPVIWGSGASPGYVQAVPTAFSGTPGSASLELGWGPETFQDPLTTGTAPLGEYENGIWQQSTAVMQWIQAGGIFQRDTVFQAAIGGYFKNAILMMASGAGLWRSTVENNVVDPETGTPSAPATGWAVLQPNTYAWGSLTGVPNLVLVSAFTTGQVIGVNGSQDTPDGYRNQWMEIPVSGAADTIVPVTYPRAFATTSYRPRASVFDPSLNAGNASNSLIVSVVSNTLTGCTVALGQNGGGARDVVLMVDVRGRTV